MPAIVFLFAGMARSYICHRLTCDHQGPTRLQPCSDLRVHRVIANLRGDSRTAFRPYPHQSVPTQ